MRAAAAGISENSGGNVALIFRYLVLMWRYRKGR